MELTDTERSLVRDYVGLEAPTDEELDAIAEPCTYWQEVALRVLRRRRADSASGGSPSFSLSGVLAVGPSKGDIPTLDSAISELERQLAELTGETYSGGVTVGRIQRPDRAR